MPGNKNASGKRVRTISTPQTSPPDDVPTGQPFTDLQAPFICEHCGRIFEDEKELKRHTEEVLQRTGGRK